ncbi:MAG: hypothetical protein ACXWLM_10865, partial [Myxococcales bacterium]
AKDIPVDESEGDVVDPLDQRPPAYVKAPPIELGASAYVAKKVQPPTNDWPDPVPKESEPAESWTAPARKPRFVPGPALAAFEAERSTPPPAAAEASEDEGVFQFAPPEEAPSAPSEDSFAAAQAAFAAWSSQHDQVTTPTSVAPVAADSVPRSVYEALLAEKQELQQRLYAALEERNTSDRVPRELFDQVQAEKRQLQEKMMLMLDELLRLRQSSSEPEPEKEQRGNVRPFPGSRKNE